jgi:hypothetical protein
VASLSSSYFLVEVVEIASHPTPSQAAQTTDQLAHASLDTSPKQVSLTWESVDKQKPFT